ncbi:hypothetical protein EVAR_72374_1, partial [Eumeta japonica]
VEGWRDRKDFEGKGQHLSQAEDRMDNIHHRKRVVSNTCFGKAFSFNIRSCLENSGHNNLEDLNSPVLEYAFQAT